MWGTATTKSPTAYAFGKSGALPFQTVFTWLLITGAPYVAGPFDLHGSKACRSSFNDRKMRLFLSELLRCFTRISCEVQMHTVSDSQRQEGRRIAHIGTEEGEYV